jgi:hypothetical protein
VRKLRLVAVSAALGGLVLFGTACGSQQETPSTSPSATSGRALSPITTATTSAPANGLVGFGTSETVWNAHNTSDGHASYDGGKYVVDFDEQGNMGILIAHYPVGTTIAQAHQLILQIMPSGATTDLFTVKLGCAQEEINAPALVAGIGGSAFVEFSTGPDTNATYDPNNASWVLVEGFPRLTTASQLPAC